MLEFDITAHPFSIVIEHFIIPPEVAYLEKCVTYIVKHLSAENVLHLNVFVAAFILRIQFSVYLAKTLTVFGTSYPSRASWAKTIKVV